jgi:hypothetical protein
MIQGRKEGLRLTHTMERRMAVLERNEDFRPESKNMA